MGLGLGYAVFVSAPTGQRSTTLPLISLLSAASTYVPISIAFPGEGEG